MIYRPVSGISGMDRVDKEKVQRIVYEMSKGSKYFENEQRKEAYIKHKIERMSAQCSKLTSNDIAHFQMVKLQIIPVYRISSFLFLILMFCGI